ncbi:MAG: SusC/RagA family TonB-linked outer membrane protein, partial [Chitinophagaceae bacterium]|nr:SusC/RagA family TonB-linked outer membrane protein [Chitinophagaceae bacterium]
MTLKRLLQASSLLLLLLSLSLSTWAQDKVITGKVTDSRDGTPVVGASVLVKGSSAAGTTTGTDGSFSISVGSNATTLLVSYVGYGTQEVTITGKTTVDVALASSGSNLNEVVVVGYGTARKRDLTGAVASVKAKDFNQGVITSPDQLIQGKAAGVLIINNSGQPGGATTVRIRGTSSIRSGNNPLFVVDGIQLPGGAARPGGGGAGIGGTPGGNPLNYINPNDIASMEILKDASATAIYGSRGANGVIIITTKRGKTGAPQLELNASTGVSTILKKLEVLDAAEYRSALSEYGLANGDYGGNVDALDEITRTGFTQNYNMAISGGTEGGRYRLSGSYLNQEGIIKESGIKKYTANFTSTFRFLESKKLGLDFNILATHTNEQIAPISNDAGFTGSLIGQALQWNPTHPLRKPKDSFPGGVMPVFGDIWVNNKIGNTTVNPLAMLAAHEDRVNVGTIIASISPSYKITNDLEYRFLYSINRSSGVRRNQLARWINIDGINGRGVASVDNAQETTQQVTNTLNFGKQVSTDWRVDALLGHEYLKFEGTGSGGGAQDFIDLGLFYYNFLQYSTQNSRGIYAYASPTSELQSFFARGNVNYKDKYLLTATIRADGSTKFGENKKYGYFPSVSLAWNLSNEEFLKNSSFVNNLKFRAGW